MYNASRTRVKQKVKKNIENMSYQQKGERIIKWWSIVGKQRKGFMQGVAMFMEQEKKSPI